MTSSGTRPTRKVLVLGASGRVGSVVVDHISAAPYVQVLTGSRTLASEPVHLDARRLHVKVDVGDLDALQAVVATHRPDVVVLCVEPPDARVHRVLIESGCSVVDVCATPRTVMSAEDLSLLAVENDVSVVLSVGVAPGLTNYVAGKAASSLGAVEHIDVTVLLGAGEAHGPDAVRWTIDGLASPRAAGSRRRRVSLPGHGFRMTYPMPFSEQWTLRRTLGVARVDTRMCLDSRLVSTLLFGLSATPAGRRVIRSRVFAALLKSSSGRVPLGGDAVLVMAEAVNAHAVRTAWVRGNQQSRTTGLIAGLVTRSLLDQKVPSGVVHIEQVPELTAEIDRNLEDLGLVFGWHETVA